MLKSDLENKIYQELFKTGIVEIGNFTVKVNELKAGTFKISYGKQFYYMQFSIFKDSKFIRDCFTGGSIKECIFEVSKLLFDYLERENQDG